MVRILETHSHTPLCKHAEGLPGEYAAVAKEKGFAGLTVTCHGPLPDGISSRVRMRPEEFDQYVELVESARKAWEGELDILLGLESDYLPGLEPWIEELHQKAEFHYILGSVHPHIPEYRERYFSGSWPELHRIYYQHLAEAAESGFYDCLAHPDIVKNLGHEEWDIMEMMPFIEEALDRIADTGVAMELNTSGINKKLPEMNPAPEILAAMRARGIKVVVGADAHVPDRVGDGYLEAYQLLLNAGYDELTFFENRQPRSVLISEGIEHLEFCKEIKT
ncbi:MAG: histidinol-phosphatase [Verrucomicrobiota bacterium]